MRHVADRAKLDERIAELLPEVERLRKVPTLSFVFLIAASIVGYNPENNFLVVHSFLVPKVSILW